MQSKIPTRKQFPTLRGAKSRRESSSQPFAEQNTGAKAVLNPARSKIPTREQFSTLRGAKIPTREQSETLRGAFFSIRQLCQRLKIRGG